MEKHGEKVNVSEVINSELRGERVETIGYIISECNCMAQIGWQKWRNNELLLLVSDGLIKELRV